MKKILLAALLVLAASPAFAHVGLGSTASFAAGLDIRLRGSTTSP